jgi:Tfp pilus assembly protein PilZ
MKGSDRYYIDGITCRYDGQPMPVANLSVSGLFAATDRPPRTGDMVTMDVLLKGKQPFSVLGRVAWINRNEAKLASHLPAGFGVKITKIAFADKLAILHVLQETDPERQRPRVR